MLKSISFKNYKAFKQKVGFEIKPLTIIVGENNVGKTSITDLFLFLNNNIDPIKSGNIINYSGEYFDFGGFSRIINSNSKDSKIEINLKFENHLKFKEKEGYSPDINELESIALDTLVKRFWGGYYPTGHYNLKKALGIEIFNDFLYLFGNPKSKYKSNKDININIDMDSFNIKFLSGILKGNTIQCRNLSDNNPYSYYLEGGKNATFIYYAQITYFAKILNNLYDHIFKSIFKACHKRLAKRDNFISLFLQDLLSLQRFTISLDNIFSYKENEYSDINERRYSTLYQLYLMDHIDPQDNAERIFIDIPDWLHPYISTNKKESAGSTQSFWFNGIRNEELRPYLGSFERKINATVFSNLVLLIELSKALESKQQKLNAQEKIIIAGATKRLITEFVEYFYVKKDTETLQNLKNISKHFKFSFKDIYLIESSKEIKMKTYNDKSLRQILGAAVDLFKNKTQVLTIQNQFFNPFRALEERTLEWNTLLIEINKSLLTLGFNYKVIVENHKINYENFYTVKLQQGTDKYGLHEVGYGIAHLLPILFNFHYTKMLCNNQGIIIIREPEANIHPAAQASIAKLISNSNTDSMGPRLIIESHSEHFIRGVQIEIAKGNISKDDVSILYVGKRKNGNSYIKELELEDKGKFKSEWPKGFFESGFKEVTELMKLQG